MDSRSADLSAALRRAGDALAPLRTRTPAAARALDLLERDLLPRTAGGDLYLVVGIVGPNNAGKSALFNALVGRDLSPSAPTGGATRRLVGAAHPDLLARLGREPTLARFRMQPFGDAAADPDEPLRPTSDPACLLVAPDSDLPTGLMLIDTPDFDSILEDNRLASESLLAVADLVVAVVTKHSYQNREVVRFLEHWLHHGRPWMLVYNEGPDEEVARAHARKLAADVGTPPLGVYWAPHSKEVQGGTARLEPCSLEDSTGARLRDHLFDIERIADVKTRAFAAALARLGDEMRAAAAALGTDAGIARDLLAAARERGLDAGLRIAAAVMPGQPFIEAFRAVLDRRTNPISRSWRAMLRRARLRLESLPSLFAGRGTADEAARAAETERGELRKAWPSFWEEIARDLGPEARHAARVAAPPDVAGLLDRDLADDRRAPARERAEQALDTEPADVDAFRAVCESLVEKAIEERGFELDIQAAADIATVLPIAFAAAVIVHTGGVGSDIAAMGGGAVSTFLVEKYAHLLGTGIMADARRRWAEMRGSQLADVLVGAALAESAPRLRHSNEEDARRAEEIGAMIGELPR